MSHPCQFCGRPGASRQSRACHEAKCASNPKRNPGRAGRAHRQRLIEMIAQGLASGTTTFPPTDFARLAVDYADAILNEMRRGDE